jgi:hypothetical protein
MQVNTFLPGFNGFYGSIYEPNEEYELDHINDIRLENNLDPIELDDLEFDYKAYYQEVSQEITLVVEGILKDLNLVKSIEYQSLVSPKYYNFSNDSIEVGIIPNAKNIVKYWNKHKNKWNQYLKDNYTSYDGFISSYDNENWSIETILEGTHELGSFLQFALMNEGINEYDIYEDVESASYISCSNYDDAITMAVKPQIPSILQGKLIFGCMDQINALKEYNKRLDNWNQKTK